MSDSPATLGQGRPEDSVSVSRARRSGPVATALTVVALGVVAYVAVDMRADFAYWLFGARSVDLGSPTAYELDRARHNVVARINGTPGPTANRFEMFGKRYEIVAVKGTNIVVRRVMPGPHLPKLPGAAELPPDPNPFDAEGRLVRDDKVPEYAAAFGTLVERGEAAPHDGHLYVLLDGELPHRGWRVPLIMAGLLLLALINVTALVRYYKFAQRPR